MRPRIAALALLAVMAGCVGGDDDPAAPTSPASSTPATAIATVTPTPFVTATPPPPSPSMTPTPLVTATPSPSASRTATSTTATPTQAITVQVLADAVPVHVGANARTHVIGTLARGDVAEVLGFDKFRVDGFVGLAGIGWVRYDPSSIELSAPPKEVPHYFGHILDPAHLPGTRTGVATVDRVLDLLDDGDAAGLIALAPASPVPCVQPGQFDGPVCPDGTEPGTPVDAFTSLTCHGEHDPTAERAIGALVRGNPEPRRGVRRLRALERRPARLRGDRVPHRSVLGGGRRGRRGGPHRLHAAQLRA